MSFITVQAFDSVPPVFKGTMCKLVSLFLVRQMNTELELFCTVNWRIVYTFIMSLFRVLQDPGSQVSGLMRVILLEIVILLQPAGQGDDVELVCLRWTQGRSGLEV